MPSQVAIGGRGRLYGAVFVRPVSTRFSGGQTPDINLGVNTISWVDWWTILLVEPYFDFVLDLAGEVTVLRRGEVIFAVTKSETGREELLPKISGQGRGAGDRGRRRYRARLGPHTPPVRRP